MANFEIPAYATALGLTEGQVTSVTAILLDWLRSTGGVTPIYRGGNGAAETPFEVPESEKDSTMVQWRNFLDAARLGCYD